LDLEEQASKEETVRMDSLEVVVAVKLGNLHSFNFIAQTHSE